VLAWERRPKNGLINFRKKKHILEVKKKGRKLAGTKEGRNGRRLSGKPDGRSTF